MSEDPSELSGTDEVEGGKGGVRRSCNLPVQRLLRFCSTLCTPLRVFLHTSLAPAKSLSRYRDDGFNFPSIFLSLQPSNTHGLKATYVLATSRSDAGEGMDSYRLAGDVEGIGKWEVTTKDRQA
jgi:hypothetical protein